MVRENTWMAAKHGGRAGGRPRINPGGERFALQLHGEYRDKVNELQDRLNTKYAPARFLYLSDVVHWAIDVALAKLKEEKRS